MTIREITFGEAEPSPGLVIRALEIMGLDGKSTLKGPLKRNGKVVGCLVRFNDAAEADKFVEAWNGFLEMKKTGKPAFSFTPSYSFTPSVSLPEISLRLGGGESETSSPSRRDASHLRPPTLRGGKGSE